MDKIIRNFFKDRGEAARSHSDLAGILASLYIVISLSIIIARFFSGVQTLITPEYLFLILLSAAIVLGKKYHSAISDFGIPLLLIFSYDVMRGYSYEWIAGANYSFPIFADKLIGFGQLPNEIIQKTVDSSQFAGAVFFSSVLLYSLHFTVPILFGFLLWLKSRKDYMEYMASLVVLSYLALVTFWIFPVAPPWLAAQNGFAQVSHKFVENLTSENVQILPGLYDLVNANPVAAIPSLHFGYPFLAFLFAFFSKRRYASIFFAFYSLAVAFSLVYLGEHYVVDLAAGAVYAFVAMNLVKYAEKNQFFLPIQKRWSLS